MPIFVAILIILVFTGGIGGSRTSTTPTDESDVIISTVSGGLAHSTRENENLTTGIVLGNAPTINLTTPSQASQPQTSQPTVKIPPQLDTLSPQDLTRYNARLRGKIDFVGDPYPGKLYFLYSDERSEVQDLSIGAAIVVVSNSVKSDTYSRIAYGLFDDTRYYYRVCFDAESTTCGDIESFTTVEDERSGNDYRLPTVYTQRTENIQGEFATLEGSYRSNDSKYNVVFFVYGEDWSQVNEIPDKFDEYNEVKENGDDLQKVRAGVNAEGNIDYSKTIDDLETSTTYYHRICVAYDDDEATGISCGYTNSFQTKSRQKDIPEISNSQASVSGSSAELSTRISMEDYSNGYAFVVYGISENRIENVANFDRFNQIYQSGDNLQRITIDDDFDGSDSVSVTVRDLVSGTQYYRFCVEYEGENDYGYDVDDLICGDVESFLIQ